MAQYTDITLTADAWTQLTDADVTAITFQNKGRYPIHIKATTGATAPTSFDGALRYDPWQGERNVAMADLFAGLPSAARVWGYAEAVSGKVAVSHA